MGVPHEGEGATAGEEVWKRAGEGRGAPQPGRGLPSELSVSPWGTVRSAGRKDAGLLQQQLTKPLGGGAGYPTS